jgi:hypothetical protein
VVRRTKATPDGAPIARSQFAGSLLRLSARGSGRQRVTAAPSEDGFSDLGTVEHVNFNVDLRITMDSEVRFNIRGRPSPTAVKQ